MQTKLGWTVTPLRNTPRLFEAAAAWFADRWHTSPEAVRKTLAPCMEHPHSLPQWYVILDGTGQISAGAGVVENDCHPRQELGPNIQGLFVDTDYRKLGAARALLDFIRSDMAAQLGINRLFLLTGQPEPFQRCGWNYVSDTVDSQGLNMHIFTAYTPGPLPISVCRLLYTRLEQRIRHILSDRYAPVSYAACAAAIFRNELPCISWVGFYLLDRRGCMMLGPFQGQDASLEIFKGHGICGAAWAERKILQTDMLHMHPGYEGFDPESRSALTVPLFSSRKIFGLLHLESPVPNRFTPEDQAGLALLAATLEPYVCIF